jgi:hypothetical protein
MPILPSVAGFRWTSDNCDSYHHLRDTERKLKKVRLHWDQFKENPIRLVDFKKGMVKNIIELLSLKKDDKISLGKRQHELDTKIKHAKEVSDKDISLALDRCTKYKDGGKLLELAFASKFFHGDPIDIKTDLNSVDFKEVVNARLTKSISDDEKKLMSYCASLVEKYDGIDMGKDLKDYLKPRISPRVDRIDTSHFYETLKRRPGLRTKKHKDDFIHAVCNRFVKACGLYTISLENGTKRIVSLWLDEFFRKKTNEDIDNQTLKSVRQLVRNKKDSTSGSGFCLLTGFQGPIILEHLVEYSQAGILLTPLGTQYPFGYVNKHVNTGILLKQTNNETTLQEYTSGKTLIKDKEIYINRYRLILLQQTLKGQHPDDSPLKWKSNGYVGRLLIQYLVDSKNDDHPLEEEDYVRFLYALDIYYKSQCALRNENNFNTVVQEMSDSKIDDWGGGVKRQLDVLSGVEIPDDINEAERVKRKKFLKDIAQLFPVSVDRTDDWINEEEEEEEDDDDDTRPTKKLKPAWQPAWQPPNVKKRTRDSAGGTTKRQQGGKIATGEVKCIYYYFKDLIPTEIWSEPNDNEFRLFKMLLDIYIEDEKDSYGVVDPSLLTLIPYGRYSDVMRFFFTTLDIYQLEVDHASLQFDFEYMLYSKFYYPTNTEPIHLMDSIQENLGNNITGPYTAEKSLEYILSKVILILRTFNETFSIDEGGEFIPNIELDDEDDITTPAVPSLRELMARPAPGLGLVTHDDVLGTVDAPMATSNAGGDAPMVTAGDEVATPVDDDDADAPMATGDDAATPVDDDDDAAAPMATGGDEDAAPVNDGGGGDRSMVNATATDDSSGGDAAVSVSDGSSDNAAKRQRNRGGKKTRKQKKRIHKKSHRKPRRSVSPGRWLRKPKRHSRNKRFKLRKRNTQKRKTKKRKKEN